MKTGSLWIRAGICLGILLVPQGILGQVPDQVPLDFSVEVGAPVHRIVLKVNDRFRLAPGPGLNGAGARIDKDQLLPEDREPVIVFNNLLDRLEGEGMTVRPVFSNDDAQAFAGSSVSSAAEKFLAVVAPDLVTSLDKVLPNQPPGGANTLRSYVEQLRRFSGLLERLAVEPYPEVSSAPAFSQRYLGSLPGIEEAPRRRPFGVSSGSAPKRLPPLVVDIECDIEDQHIDLPQREWEIFDVSARSGEPDDRSHGAAVLGIVAAQDEERPVGIRGLAPNSRVGFAAISCKTLLEVKEPFVASSVEDILLRTGKTMGPGDVIILPIEFPAIQLVAGCRNPACSKLPLELAVNVRIAIQALRDRGITVVESAGNGGCDLDGVKIGKCESAFSADSGAILVGAGKSDNSARIRSSNYGSPVDLHAWGENVTTLGYCDLTYGAPPTECYTDVFSDTSSATAIVAGVVASLQSAALEKDRAVLTPERLRALLVRTGVTGGLAGPLPSLRKAIDGLEDLK